MAKSKIRIEDLDLESKNIFDFSDESPDTDFVPMYYPPKKEGYYLTIKCGLGGIYKTINEYKNGEWTVRSADASIVVAYSEDLIPDELVKEWCLNKIEKSKHKDK